jgi:hypothetical protein
LWDLFYLLLYERAVVGRGTLRKRLHGPPRLIHTVESMILNSAVERNFLHGSTKVSEPVDSKMAANELVRQGVVVIWDYLRSIHI